jgi:hypothetical protein
MKCFKFLIKNLIIKRKFHINKRNLSETFDFKLVNLTKGQFESLENEKKIDVINEYKNKIQKGYNEGDPYLTFLYGLNKLKGGLIEKEEKEGIEILEKAGELGYNESYRKISNLLILFRSLLCFRKK